MPLDKKPIKHYQTSIPGYTRKVYIKLAKRVHADLKKKGLKPKWNESQKFAARYLFPQYKTEILSNIDLKDVDNIVDYELSQTTLKEKIRVPIREIVEECDSVFQVPPSDLTIIEWYDIGPTLSIMPAGVKLRVNGGIFGMTTIEKNSDLDYHADGIAAIVAEIRKEVNNESGPEYYWEGATKLVPGRADNGNNCNYFIDFVLEINGQLVPSPETEVQAKEKFVELKGEEGEQRIARKKLAELEKKQRQLKAKAENEEKKLEKKKLEEAKKRKRAKASPTTSEEVTQDYAKILELLYRDYKEGLFTVKEYKKERAEILRKLNKS